MDVEAYLATSALGKGCRLVQTVWPHDQQVSLWQSRNQRSQADTVTKLVYPWSDAHRQRTHKNVTIGADLKYHLINRSVCVPQRENTQSERLSVRCPLTL